VPGRGERKGFGQKGGSHSASLTRPEGGGEKENPISVKERVKEKGRGNGPVSIITCVGREKKGQ